MEQLYIIIPAYNEEKNIANVINQWYPIVEKYHGDNNSRLIIIDDGSQDNTPEIIEEYCKKNKLLVLLKKENSGHGASILYGYQYAIEKKVDYIFQTDSDGQTIPEDFEKFWKDRQDYDMLIGERVNRQDGRVRILVTKVLKVVIYLCFGVFVKDANTPFRLMKTSTLSKYIYLIPEEFNLSNVLISVIFQKKNCKVKYIPITFKERQAGVNSINIGKIIKIGNKAIKDFIVLNRLINKR